MLGKLFKHEFKAVIRVYSLLCILVAIFTFMMIVYDRILNDNIQKLTGWLHVIAETMAAFLGMGYFLVLLAVNILTFVYLIYRFYQTMVCDEGYLTHTLPVTTGQLIFTKTATTFCFQVLSAAVTVFSILLLVIGAGAWSDLVNICRGAIEELRDYNVFGINFSILIFLGILLVIAMVIFNILTYYMCISAGNLFSSHKLLGSVVVYLLFDVIKGIISAIIMVFGMWSASKRLNGMSEKVLATEDIENWGVFHSPSEILGFINSYMVAGVILMILGCAILFFVSRYILKNKLNLA